MAKPYDLFKKGILKITRPTYAVDTYIELFPTPDGEYFQRTCVRHVGSKKLNENSDLLIGDNWVPFEKFTAPDID